MKYTREHFISALTKLFNILRVTLLPFLIFTYITQDGKNAINFLLGYVGVFSVLFVFAILKWRSTLYIANKEHVKIQTGWLYKEVIIYPIQTIQGLNFTSNVVYNWLKVVRMNIETAGISNGSSAEIVISQSEAKRIQALVFPEQEVNFENRNTDNRKSMSTKELIIMSSTSAGVFVGLSILYGLYLQVQQVFPNFTKKIIEESKLLSSYQILNEDYPSQIVFMDIFWFVLLVLCLMGISWLVGTISTILKYKGFSVYREGDSLKVSYGFFVTKQLNLPVHRIQALKIEEGLGRQPFGLATIKVESIGYGEESGSQAVLFPLIKKKDLAAFLEEFLPEFYLVEELETAPKTSLKRYFFRGTLLPLLIGIVLSYFYNYGYLFFLTIPLFVYLSYLRYKDAGMKMTEKELFLRRRLFSKETVIIPNKSIQSASVKQSFYQKRDSVSHYEVSIASDQETKSFTVKDLKDRERELLMKWIFTSQEQPVDEKPTKKKT